MNWINVKDQEPEKESLAVNAIGDLLIGYIYYDDEQGFWTCEGDGVILEQVTHYIHTKDIPRPKRT